MQLSGTCSTELSSGAAPDKYEQGQSKSWERSPAEKTPTAANKASVTQPTQGEPPGIYPCFKAHSSYRTMSNQETM